MRSVVDATGAGDLFSAGFIYGALRGESLRRCCERGCLCGAAVVGDLGGEVSEEGWAWVRARERERKRSVLD
jgi:sugar/nucleoside kinase (ribokinase family)